MRERIADSCEKRVHRTLDTLPHISLGELDIVNTFPQGQKPLGRGDAS